MSEFEKFKIKEYSLWELYLHKAQYPYVGRCYAVAKRSDAKRVTDMTMQEAEELFGLVVPEWNKAVRELFQYDWPNVAILGNDWPHLHAHLIPRYYSPRLVHGIEFVDPNPKGNYAPYPKKELDLAVLLRIKEDMKSKL